MKIKAIENYFDLQIKKQILIDDEYEVGAARAKELCDKKLVQIVEEKENGKRKVSSKSKKV